MKDDLFLNIAGFNIKISFKKTEWEFAHDKLKGEIKNPVPPWRDEHILCEIEIFVQVSRLRWPRCVRC